MYRLQIPDRCGAVLTGVNLDFVGASRLDVEVCVVDVAKLALREQSASLIFTLAHIINRGVGAGCSIWRWNAFHGYTKIQQFNQLMIIPSTQSFLL